jgi:imidazoleglycerol-phosphate dehydratase/histidinol-phosphatase
MSRRAPFPPLVANADGLDAPPSSTDALRKRMAEVYGVPETSILPVRGVWHGTELVLRCASLDGLTAFSGPDAPELDQLARIYRFERGDGGVRIARGPLKAEQARTGEGLLVVDESDIEFADAPSLAPRAAETEALVVLRSLSIAYGLAGVPCAALIAAPQYIARLREVLEPDAIATPIIRLALSALDPSRAQANQNRIAQVKTERARVATALGAIEEAGPSVRLSLSDKSTTQAAFARFGVSAEFDADSASIAIFAAPEINDRALAAMGVASSRARRRAETIRETLETRIIAQVDLDAEATPSIHTGIGFYDHMLSQVATHGGFALTLDCAGDLEVDTHHSIEDSALALGQALKDALGARRGIARFGFLLPMDEAEAKVSIDLGGRPYLVFDGAFDAPLLGEYPTEMTEHVFRSLAQSMGAAIHIAVTGENDHHKTEACFKAFGRALRQAIRIEGEALPSTKGAI